MQQARRRSSLSARRRSSLGALGAGGAEGSKGGPVGAGASSSATITLETVLGPSFSLEDALSLDLHKHVEACTETVEVATKELKVETRLRSIEDRWQEEQLEFVRQIFSLSREPIVWQLQAQAGSAFCLCPAHLIFLCPALSLFCPRKQYRPPRASIITSPLSPFLYSSLHL